MKKEQIIRAWKDPEYRASLSSQERADLPECPSGAPLAELEEGALGQVAGGRPLATRPRTCMYVCWSVDVCYA